jgi:hypothetical protein
MQFGEPADMQRPRIVSGLDTLIFGRAIGFDGLGRSVPHPANDGKQDGRR